MWDEFPLEGKWWLPATPDKSVAGRLEYSEDSGAKLSLLGCLNNNDDDRRGTQYPAILGRTYGTPQVTLFRCRGSRGYSSSPSGRIDKESCRASLVLLGHHYNDEKEVLFSEISSQFTYLNLWGDIRIIESAPGDDLQEIVKIRKPVQRELVKTETYTLSLWAYANQRPDFYSASATQTTRLVFSFNKPTPLEDYWPLMRDAQNLLTLLIGEPTAPSDFHGSTQSEPPVSVTIKQRFSFQGPPKNLHPLELLLPLNKMGDRAQELIRAWFQKAEPLRPIYNLALAPVYNDALYAEQRFLAIVQGLESYHRKMKGGDVIPKAEHDARVDAILSAAPEQYKAWLKRRMRNSNEPHLEKRLQLLGDQFPGYVHLLNQRTPNFFGRVATTRNYLTHFDEKNREGSFSPNELYFPSEKLRILFWMCMLAEMGYTAAEAENIAMGYGNFSAILRFN